MESRGGSELHPLEERALRARPPRPPEESDRRINDWYLHFGVSIPPNINTVEMNAIGHGEPYCFLCGKPASAFSGYRDMVHEAFPEVSAADYVRDEEGTYNPDTNRFACDECYIRIGMPSGPNGWKAP